jgi:hypothetical protein
MLTPAQAARKREQAGQRLNQPWQAAAGNSVYFRRGQLAMVVAAPGVGKSVLLSAYVVQSGVRTLYLSMDTDSFTTCIRLVCARTACTMEQAEAGLSASESWALAALDSLGHVRYAFTSSPDETEIADRILAYAEAEGDYPEMVVIDNLGNVAFNDEEFAGLRRVMRDLQSTAGETGSSVVTLHHATGEYENGDLVVPMRGVSGKLSKFPSMIVTASRPRRGALGVSVVKNRFGPADPAGFGVQFQLYADLERVQVHDDYVVGASSNVAI